MPRVVFTQNLQRYVACPPVETRGETVRALLEGVFATNPRLRGYILDDQGRLRRHMVVFVDGQLIEDRVGLTDPVAESSEVAVLQALSGG
jgi:molybdopterin synthase sulfur carrier subunit